MTTPHNCAKVIHVGLDMSLSELAAKLEKLQDCEVLCVIPESAALSYNAVNFTVIKNLATDKNLDIAIITRERDTAYLAKQAGFEVYRSLKKDAYSQLKSGPLYSIDHVVRFHDQRPQKRTSKKMTLKELLARPQAMGENLGGVYHRLLSYVWKQKSQSKTGKLLWNAPHRQAVLVMLGISVTMFLAILYVALPSATVEIVPYATTTEQAINITVRDPNADPELLEDKLTVSGQFLLSENISLTVPYYTTGKIFEGENARGQIRVVNKADRPWTFVPRTQFHTPEGLIFRAVNYVNVPANSSDGYGEAIIDVVADEFDVSGQPVGARGNIKPTKFNIAKLPELSQELISGVSDTVMGGGVTKTSTMVSLDDITAAKDLGRKTLEDSALDYLKSSLQAKGLSEDYRILQTYGSFSIDDVTTTFSEDVLGTAVESFPVTISGTIKGFAINETELFNLLTNELKKRQTPRKRLAEVDTSGITYRVMNYLPNDRLLELTTTVKAIEVYDLGIQTLAGTNMLNRFRENISGMRLDDATRYLENLPEIDRVEIKRWPFWAPTIPSISDNISFEIISSFSN